MINLSKNWNVLFGFGYKKKAATLLQKSNPFIKY